MMWDEEKRKKAIEVFKRVYGPGWTVASNITRCPECAKQSPHGRVGLNFCEAHKWANEKWLTGGEAAMITAIAIRDPRLKEALKAEGLWPATD